jgi:hypothetical protein
MSRLKSAYSASCHTDSSRDAIFATPTLTECCPPDSSLGGALRDRRRVGPQGPSRWVPRGQPVQRRLAVPPPGEHCSSDAIQHVTWTGPAVAYTVRYLKLLNQLKLTVELLSDRRETGTGVASESHSGPSEKESHATRSPGFIASPPGLIEMPAARSQRQTCELAHRRWTQPTLDCLAQNTRGQL